MVTTFLSFVSISSGIAISLAHDGKTRGELAYELSTLDDSEVEDNSEKEPSNNSIKTENERKIIKRNPFFVSTYLFYTNYQILYVHISSFLLRSNPRR